MPDGFSLDLDQFHGLNQIGETGLRDQVNHHYGQVFGISLAVGAIAGLATINTGSGLKYLEAYGAKYPRETPAGETDKLGGLITPR